MSMRNRNRRLAPAPRRERVIVTTEVALTLVAGNINEASQQVTNQVTNDLEARLGRTARNATVGHVWVNGLWFTQAIVTTGVLIGLNFGMGIFSAGMDAGDFPALQAHVGPWFVHRNWRLIDRVSATAIPTPLDPDEAAIIDIDNRSMRKLGRVNDEVFVVIQKDVVTEENIQFHSDVTVLWILGD